MLAAFISQNFFALVAGGYTTKRRKVNTFSQNVVSSIVTLSENSCHCGLSCSNPFETLHMGRSKRETQWS